MLSYLLGCVSALPKLLPLLGSLETGSRWMLWFFRHAPSGLCLHAVGSYWICFSRAMIQVCFRALEEKVFFLHFTALFSVRTESSKFLRMLFCNLNVFLFFPLDPQDKSCEALLTCCTGLR